MLRLLPRSVRAALWLAALSACSILIWAPSAQGQGKSSNAAKTKFSAAADLQNEELFDLAIGEYREFLKQFPDDPLAAKAQHYLGVCLVQEKQFAEAATELAAVVSAHPKFELLDETLMNLGTARYSVAAASNDKKDFAKAAEAYASLVEQFPKSKLIPTALYNQGESYYAVGQRDKAAAAYKQLLEGYPKDKLRPDALYALGVSQLELDQADEAQATFNTFLSDFPDNKLVTRVNMYRADALFDLDKFKEAQDLYASVAAVEGFDLADRATMRQADCLSSAKKYAEAADLFASVVEKFPKSPQVPAATLAAGVRYQLAGNHDKAVDWLTKVKGKDATESAHWLARSYLETKRPAEALAAVEQVLPKAKDKKYYVDLLLDQADAMYEIPDRRKESVALYAALAENHPNTDKAPVALYYAAWSAFNVEQYDAALKYADAFIKDHAGHELLPAVQSVAADSYLNTSAFDRAEKFYADLLASQPKHADARRWQMLLGWTLYRQNRYQDTIKSLTESLPGFDSAESRAEALFLIGSSQFALKDYKGALENLQQALKDNAKGPQADELLLLLSRTQRQLKKLDDAIATARKLISEFPKSDVLDRANYHLAEYLYARGQYQEAADQYAAFLEAFPKSALAPAARYWLGWSQIGLKDYAAAITSLDGFLTAHPDHDLAAQARYARAQAHRLKGDYAACVEDVNAYVATNPPLRDKSGALFERGLAEMELKRFGDAVKTFQAIMDEDPKYPAADKVLYQLAWSLKEEDRQADAAATFERLAAEHAGSSLAAEALYHVGEQQYADKQYDKAAETYKQAEQKATKSKQRDIAEMAAHKLGWTYYHQGDFGSAHETFAGQLKSFPEGSLATDTRFMAAECLFKQDQFEEALAAYQQVRAKLPESKDFQLLTLLHAGQAASQLKQWDDCLTLLEECRESFPKSAYLPDVQFEIATARKNKGELDQALATFGEVADGTQREVGARARLMMGEIKFEQGQHKEAIRDFFKVFRGYKGAPESYNRWKAQAAYETGRCFEVLKSVPSAKKYYQEVVDNYPDSQVAELAKQRLAVLD